MAEDYGGALYITNSDYIKIDSNIFDTNYIDNDTNGYGMACMFYDFKSGGDLIFVNNVLHENGDEFDNISALDTMCVYDVADVSITNNTFTDNIATDESTLIVWADTQDCDVDVYNTIFWHNSGDYEIELYESQDYDLVAEVKYCDVDGGDTSEIYYVFGVSLTKSNNINVDPAFEGPTSDNYHLTGKPYNPISPCIDTGLNSAPDIPNRDMDGDYRIIDGDYDGTDTVDIGADEDDPPPN